MFEILGGILILSIMILLSGLKIVKEHNRLVVFRFGKVLHCKGPGMQMVVPLIDRSHSVDTRIVTLPIESMEAVTKDNFHVKVSAVCMSQVIDAAKAVTRINDPQRATAETAQAVILTVLNRHTARELVHDRQGMTRSLKAELERRTRHWGIRIKSIELKEMDLPAEVRETLTATVPPLAPDNHNSNGNNSHNGEIGYQYHSELQQTDGRD